MTGRDGYFVVCSLPIVVANSGDHGDANSAPKQLKYFIQHSDGTSRSHPLRINYAIENVLVSSL